MNQEIKRKISKTIKPILRRYKLKGTLSVVDRTEILLTLTEGSLCFGKYNFIQLNKFWLQRLERDYQGNTLNALKELRDALSITEQYNIHVGRYYRHYLLVN